MENALFILTSCLPLVFCARAGLPVPDGYEDDLSPGGSIVRGAVRGTPGPGEHGLVARLHLLNHQPPHLHSLQRQVQVSTRLARVCDILLS